VPFSERLNLLPVGDAGHRRRLIATRVRKIRRLAEMLPGGSETEYGFSCECGCGEIVQLSAAEVEEQGGVWLDGHRSFTGVLQPAC
jgi:hypothetical protein